MLEISSPGLAVNSKVKGETLKPVPWADTKNGIAKMPTPKKRMKKVKNVLFSIRNK
jgi:hypothetical protein